MTHFRSDAPMEEVTRKFFEMCTETVADGNEENNNNNAIDVRV